MSLFLCVTLGLMCSYVLQVNINRPKHTCGSVNNCGDTMTSNAWAAARAVELLKDKPSMGPKELHDQLKRSIIWRCYMIGFLEAKRRPLMSYMGSGMTVMTYCLHKKLMFLNQCLAVLWNLTLKKNASRDSLLLRSHVLMVSHKVVDHTYLWMPHT
jgi:hypothetical protein